MFLETKRLDPVHSYCLPAVSSVRGFMLLKEAIDTFLEWKSLSRPRAGKCYKSPLLLFEKKTRKELEQITVDDLTHYALAIREIYSQTTYSYNMTVLRGFIKYWYDRGMLLIKPSIIEIPRYRQNPYRAITETEYEMIDDYLDTEPQNFATKQKRLIIRFLWETGMRVSEVCELSYKNLLSEKTIIYNKKNSLQRWVFWSVKTQELLDDFLKERKLYGGDSLFVTFEGAMSTRCVQRLIKNLCITLDLPDFVPHSFRHGRAHYILKKGGDVKSIQSILGHTNPISSFRYLHLSEQETGERARKFL